MLNICIDYGIRYEEKFNDTESVATRIECGFFCHLWIELQHRLWQYIQSHKTWTRQPYEHLKLSTDVTLHHNQQEIMSSMHVLLSLNWMWQQHSIICIRLKVQALICTSPVWVFQFAFHIVHITLCNLTLGSYFTTMWHCVISKFITQVA